MSIALGSLCPRQGEGAATVADQHQIPPAVLRAQGPGVPAERGAEGAAPGRKARHGDPAADALAVDGPLDHEVAGLARPRVGRAVLVGPGLGETVSVTPDPVQSPEACDTSEEWWAPIHIQVPISAKMPSMTATTTIPSQRDEGRYEVGSSGQRLMRPRLAFASSAPAHPSSVQLVFGSRDKTLGLLPTSA